MSVTPRPGEDPLAEDTGVDRPACCWGFGAWPKMCRHVLRPFMVASAAKQGMN